MSFRKLHESGCFVMPNPWDAGSARLLESLGFPALASTSAGFAWSQARADGHVTRAAKLEHLRALVSSVKVPINADFESGYGERPEDVAESVRLCAATGVGGLSIEDSAPGGKLRELPEALERLQAARAAAPDVVLTARAECFLLRHPDPLRESLKRLEAYAAAGADCLYAPGLRTREQVEAVVKAVAPKPVNVLVYAPFFTVAELRELGVRRISVGAALARTAWRGFIKAAQEIASGGTFTQLDDGTPPADLNGLFRS